MKEPLDAKDRPGHPRDRLLERRSVEAALPTVDPPDLAEHEIGGRFVGHLSPELLGVDHRHDAVEADQVSHGTRGEGPGDGQRLGHAARLEHDLIQLIVLAQHRCDCSDDDPGGGNWLGTKRRTETILLARYLLPEDERAPIVTRVVQT